LWLTLSWLMCLVYFYKASKDMILMDIQSAELFKTSVLLFV
jgi:hypothetical protein